MRLILGSEKDLKELQKSGDNQNYININENNSSNYSEKGVGQDSNIFSASPHENFGGSSIFEK